MYCFNCIYFIFFSFAFRISRRSVSFGVMIDFIVCFCVLVENGVVKCFDFCVWFV